MKNFIITFLLTLFTLAGIATSCKNNNSEKQDGAYYTCPMHPEVKKDAPGQCPVCNMDLVKKEDPSSHQH